MKFRVARMEFDIHKVKDEDDVEGHNIFYLESEIAHKNRAVEKYSKNEQLVKEAKKGRKSENRIDRYYSIMSDIYLEKLLSLKESEQWKEKSITSR